MTTKTTKCDILRDVANASVCNLCASDTVPPSCIDAAGNYPPPSTCKIPNMLNVKMKLFTDKYLPFASESTDKTAMVAADSVMNDIVSDAEKALADDYPYADPLDIESLRWSDFEYCLQNTDGTPGGPSNEKYFRRPDLSLFGMNPVYPIGGTHLSGAIWKNKPSPIPVSVDYLMNPDLFTVVVVIILILIFAGLMYSAWRTAHPYKAHHREHHRAIHHNEHHKKEA